MSEQKIYKKGILGKKLGMSQIFNQAESTRIPVTLIECGPCTILAKKTKETHGYNAILLGFDDKPTKSCDKPEIGFYKKIEKTPKRFIKELRLEDEDIKNFNIGDTLKADMFQMLQHIDVIGTSKGRGFAGVMKKYHFHGFPMKAHETKRHGGSIGCRMTPGRVFVGKKMPGHMGDVKCTKSNLQIVFMDLEKNIIGIRGSIPGANNGYIIMKQAQKKMAPTGIKNAGLYRDKPQDKKR